MTKRYYCKKHHSQYYHRCKRCWQEAIKPLVPTNVLRLAGQPISGVQLLNKTLPD